MAHTIVWPASRMAHVAARSTGGPVRAPATSTQRQHAGRSAAGEAGASTVVLRRLGVGRGAVGASVVAGAGRVSTQ
jgi:hypothetical protein